MIEENIKNIYESRTLYIMVGLPGSGKSTWAKAKAKESGCIIVNKDKIREMILGEYGYIREYETIVSDIALSSIDVALRNGRDVIIDEANLTKAKRRISVPCKKVIVWCSEQEHNLKYRMKESRGISSKKWDDVINNMKKALEIPTAKESDEIIFFKIGETDE